jgi:hypothetical protein
LRVEPKLRVRRNLIRIVDAGKPVDLAGALLGVQALDVALGADFKRGRDMHFDEHSAVNVMGGAYGCARRRVGRNHRNQRDDAVTREQPGDESDTSHVGVSVFSAEPEVGGEIRPKLISVEQFDAPAVSTQL